MSISFGTIDLHLNQTVIQDTPGAIGPELKCHGNDEAIAYRARVQTYSSHLSDGYRIHLWLKKLIKDVEIVRHAFIATEEDRTNESPTSSIVADLQALKKALTRMWAVYADVDRFQWDDAMCASMWDSQDTLVELLRLLPKSQQKQVSQHLLAKVGKHQGLSKDIDTHRSRTSLGSHARTIKARLDELNLCACVSNRHSTTHNGISCCGLCDPSSSVSGVIAYSKQRAEVVYQRKNAETDNESVTICTAPSLTSETTMGSALLFRTTTNENQVMGPSEPSGSLLTCSSKAQSAALPDPYVVPSKFPIVQTLDHITTSHSGEYCNTSDTGSSLSKATGAFPRQSRPGFPRDLGFCESSQYRMECGPCFQRDNDYGTPQEEIADLPSPHESLRLESLFTPVVRSSSRKICRDGIQETCAASQSVECQTYGHSYATERWFKSHEEPWSSLRVLARSFLRDRLHGPWSSSHAESRQLHIQLTGGPCASPQNGTPPAPLSPTCPEHVPLVDLFEKLDMQGDYKSRRTTIGAVTFANTPGEASTPPDRSHESKEKSGNVRRRGKLNGRSQNRGDGNGSSSEKSGSRKRPRKQKKEKRPFNLQGCLSCLYRDQNKGVACHAPFEDIEPLRRVRESHSRTDALDAFARLNLTDNPAAS